MKENGFKRLKEEDEEYFQERFSKEIQGNVESTLGIFRALGQFIDLYLSKLFTFFFLFMEDQVEKPDKTTASSATKHSTDDPAA